MAIKIEVDQWFSESGAGELGGPSTPAPIVNLPAENIGQPVVNTPLPILPEQVAAIVTNQNTPLNPEVIVVPPIATGGDQRPITDNIQSYEKEYITLQVAKEGFGAYLDGIVPNDIAVTAGAFSATMQQVKNILNVDFEKFAQVAYAMETTKGLDLVNGSDVPADVALANQGYKLTALGSGPNGTYTLSDLFGCMSGLPYPWEKIYNGILDLQTDKLKTIYDQLYLAVQWEQATGTVQYSTSATLVDPMVPTYNYYYTVTGVTLTDGGGGYGRSGASAPTVSITGGSGATASTTISTDNTSLGNNGTGNYGRVTTLTLTSAGSPVNYGSGSSSTAPAVGSPPTVQIQGAPKAYTSYPYSGGSNVPYGETYLTGANGDVNTAVAGLIADANAEIAVIRTTRPIKATNLNTLHNLTGVQLSIEQRARFNGISPVPQGTRDKFLNLYPSALIVFVQSIPELAKNTLPHMQVQTLEAISNLDLTAGQSIVAAMREARNAARLDLIGVPQDNVLFADFTPEEELALLINGTTATTSPKSATIPNTNSTYSFPSLPTAEKVVSLTNPAYATNIRANVPITPLPSQYFNGKDIIATPQTAPGDPDILLPILNGQNLGTGTGVPPIGAGATVGPDGQIINPSIPPTSPLASAPNSPYTSTPEAPTVLQPNTRIPTNPSIIGPGPNNLNKYGPIAGFGAGKNIPIPYPTVGTRVPAGPGVPVDVGKAPLGSFAPSKAVNLLPPNLKFASGTLLPSTFDVPEAIEEVIKCNCDCWVQ